MERVIDIVNAIEDDCWPEGMSTCDGCCDLVEDELLKWLSLKQFKYCRKCLKMWRSNRRKRIMSYLMEKTYWLEKGVNDGI